MNSSYPSLKLIQSDNKPAGSLVELIHIHLKRSTFVFIRKLCSTTFPVILSMKIGSSKEAPSTSFTAQISQHLPLVEFHVVQKADVAVVMGLILR